MSATALEVSADSASADTLAAMTSTNTPLEVVTTTPDKETALALAERVVKGRLAANAQIIGPVVGTWWHLGEYGTGEEWRVVLYTTTGRYPELEAALLKAHPWDNPQMIATEIVAGAAACLKWLEESVAAPAQ